MSLSSSSSKAVWEKLLEQQLEADNKISDEEDAEALWKELLERKGLPLDTPYKYVDTLDKDFAESYCDLLFATIRQKKKNPEAAKSWGDSAFGWLPAPPPPPEKTENDFCYHIGEMANKKIGSINYITYRDEESKKKKMDFFHKRRQENIQFFKDKEAKFGPDVFLRH